MSARWRFAIACTAGLTLTALVRAQQAPVRDAAATQVRTGSGAMTGTVIDAGSGAPVRRVLVLAIEQSGASSVGGPASVTDDAGRFLFRNLPAGRYSITAAKPAYLPAAYG